VARVAIGFLRGALDGDDPGLPRRELVAPQLVPRSSTGPAPGG
jgi:hypothetical protein